MARPARPGHLFLMAKIKDPGDELFDKLHDGESAKRLHKQARKEKRIEQRKKWWEKNKPNE